MLKKQLLLFSLTIPLNFHLSKKIFGFRFFPIRICATFYPVIFPARNCRQRSENKAIDHISDGINSLTAFDFREINLKHFQNIIRAQCSCTLHLKVTGIKYGNRNIGN